jgi:hypothetical protein
MCGHSFYILDSRREQILEQGNARDIAPQSFACWEDTQYPIETKNRRTNLQLGHQRLQSVQELASCVMRRRLLVELPLECGKKLVELFRFDHRPWDNLQFSSVKTCDEISILLVLNYLLKFERESRYCQC